MGVTLIFFEFSFIGMKRYLVSTWQVDQDEHTDNAGVEEQLALDSAAENNEAVLDSNDAPLMQSIEISHHQLTASLQTQIVRDLGYFRELVCDSAEFHLGSLCAGSGIERKAILKLQQFWAKEFDVNITFTNKYAAESVT